MHWFKTGGTGTIFFYKTEKSNSERQFSLYMEIGSTISKYLSFDSFLC